MSANMKVIKRDGSVVEYDRNKIVTAIQKANAEVSEEERLSQDRIEAIVRRIEDLGRDKLPVEEIQDLVEQGLVNENKFYLAKTYIIYRYTRAWCASRTPPMSPSSPCCATRTRSWPRRTPTRTP